MPAPKGNKNAKGNKGGRPKDYGPHILEKVKKYIASCKDKDEKIEKQVNEEKGYVMYENRLRVKLPTLEGLATYLNVHVDTLYDWSKKYIKFSEALDKIRRLQKDTLINNGLAGTYNPTIAKLILSANHGMREKVDVTESPFGRDDLGEYK